MAHEVPILQTSFKSTGDLSAKQFCAVKLDTANDESVVIAAANTDNCIGVLTNAPTAGNPATVMMLGISKALLGGTVTRNDALMAKSDGSLITATGVNPSFAMALESGVSGDYISVFVTGGTVGAAIRNTVVSLQMDLASIANGAGPTNIFTFTPGFAGHIVSASFVVDVPVTTGAKLATVNCGVGATAVTNAGQAGIPLTSATATPMGAEIKHTAITALNAFTAVQTVTLIATAVTAFVEGSGTFLIVLSS